MDVGPGGVEEETFGYSLNGKEFLVPPGESYACVQDGFSGTAARILGGTNEGALTDSSSRPLIKTVNTGWSVLGLEAAASHVLHLWGMDHPLALWDATLTGLLPDAARTRATDAYALSMGYFSERVPPIHLGNGGFGIAAMDPSGKWVNAVDLNSGRTKRFVVGRWDPSYALGTYGVDPSTKSAWAVLDYDGDFVVMRDIEAVPGHRD